MFPLGTSSSGHVLDADWFSLSAFVKPPAVRLITWTMSCGVIQIEMFRNSVLGKKRKAKCCPSAPV
jgi:hypothetical protein